MTTSLTDNKLLPAFQKFHSVWMEITKSEHQHGGAGWEFGTCLGSPTRNARGARSYEVMRRPQTGDCSATDFLDSRVSVITPPA